MQQQYEYTREAAVRYIRLKKFMVQFIKYIV